MSVGDSIPWLTTLSIAAVYRKATTPRQPATTLFTLRVKETGGGCIPRPVEHVVDDCQALRASEQPPKGPGKKFEAARWQLLRAASALCTRGPPGL